MGITSCLSTPQREGLALCEPLEINKTVRAGQYTIPCINNIFSQSSGKQYFTTSNANKGFCQVDIQQE
jgi:hypothetical protein